MYKLSTDENLKTHYNGKLWLVADLKITKQYIGSGKTLTEAKKDAQKAIDKYNWHPIY